jgi:hypothetical protein
MPEYNTRKGSIAKEAPKIAALAALCFLFFVQFTLTAATMQHHFEIAFLLFTSLYANTITTNRYSRFAFQACQGFAC